MKRAASTPVNEEVSCAATTYWNRMVNSRPPTPGMCAESVMNATQNIRKKNSFKGKIV